MFRWINFFYRILTAIAVLGAFLVSTPSFALSCAPSAVSTISFMSSDRSMSESQRAERENSLLRDAMLTTLKDRGVVFVGKVKSLSEPMFMGWHSAQIATFEVVERLQNVSVSSLEVVVNEGLRLGEVVFVLAGTEAETQKTYRLNNLRVRPPNDPRFATTNNLLMADGVCDGWSAYKIEQPLTAKRLSIFRSLPKKGSGGAIELTLTQKYPGGGYGEEGAPIARPLRLQLVSKNGSSVDVQFNHTRESLDSRLGARLENLSAGDYEIVAPNLPGYELRCYHDGGATCQSVRVVDRALNNVFVVYEPQAKVAFTLIKPDGAPAQASFTLIASAVLNRKLAKPIVIHSENFTPHAQLAPGLYEFAFADSEFTVNAHGQPKFLKETRTTLRAETPAKSSRIKIEPGQQEIRLLLPSEYAEREILARNDNKKSENSSNYRGYMSIHRLVHIESPLSVFDRKIVPVTSQGNNEKFFASSKQWFEVRLASGRSDKTSSRIVSGNETREIVLTTD